MSFANAELTIWTLSTPPLPHEFLRTLRGTSRISPNVGDPTFQLAGNGAHAKKIAALIPYQQGEELSVNYAPSHTCVSQKKCVSLIAASIEEFHKSVCEIQWC